MSTGVNGSCPVNSLAMAEIITIRVDEKEELASVMGPMSAVAHPIPNVEPARH